MMYNILVTVDSNYILPLKVLLYSLFASNPGKTFVIYLIYAEIKEREISDLCSYVKSFKQTLTPVWIGDDYFAGAPITKHYTKTMYYRLLAHTFLPETLTRALYLDPDILAINTMDTLYNTDFEPYLFGACSHNNPIVDGINKVRLQNAGSERYYNSGVLLMNLEKQRREMNAEEIFSYMKENEKLLLLPDQDVLNGLYGDRILTLDDKLYNFDVRKRSSYQRISSGERSINWIVRNTVFLHYCGKQKPWKAKYSNKYGMLYKHYQHLTELHQYDHMLNE